MLKEEFPRAHERYLSLPVLGSILDGFLGWLVERGYTRLSMRVIIRTTRRVDEFLRRSGVRNVGDVTREALLACAPEHSQDDRLLAGTVHALEHYLDGQGLLPLRLGQQSRTEQQVAHYGRYLEDERGLAPTTIAQHVGTVREFLERIGYEEKPSHLSDLTAEHALGF